MLSNWFNKRDEMPTQTPDPIPIAPQPPTIPGLAELGDRVRDPITGFSGIVVVVAYFLNGCARCGVQPETLKDGVPHLEQHFDQAQLEIIEKGAFVPSKVTEPVDRPPGGPARESPRQRALPAPV